MGELTQRQRELMGQAKQRLEENENVPTQRLRALAQGISFNTTDELEAFARSLVTGRPYDEILQEINDGLSAYSEARPMEAMSYEIGGAALPAIAAAPFSGGTSLTTLATRAPTLMKLLGMVAPTSFKEALKWGAVHGGLSGFGSGEDLESRLAGGAVGSAAGSVIGGATEKIVPLIGGVARDVIDYARRKIGKRGSRMVENELQRLASESGMTVEEIVEGVANGTIMAENRTLQDAVRGYRASGGKAATKLKETFTERPIATRQEAMSNVESSLSDVVDPNIERAMRADADQARALESEAYAPFKVQNASPKIMQEIKDAILRVPAVKGALNKIHTAQTGSRKPLVKIVDGSVEFTSDLTVEQAEIARRTIDNLVGNEFKGGIGTVAEAFKDVETTLRDALDIDVPDLANTRNIAKMTRQARDAYEYGQTAFSKNSDIVELEIEKARSQGGDALKAYRLGAFQQIRKTMGTSRFKSFMASLTDPQKRESKALALLLPDGNADKVIKSLERANLSQEASSRVLQGSDTAITQGQKARQGSSVGASDIVETLGGNPMAAMRFVSKLLKKSAPELTDTERLQIVEVLVSENPDIVRNALRDESGMAKLQSFLSNLGYAAKAGVQRGATVGVSPMIGDKAVGLLGNSNTQ